MFKTGKFYLFFRLPHQCKDFPTTTTINKRVIISHHGQECIYIYLLFIKLEFVIQASLEETPVFCSAAIIFIIRRLRISIVCRGSTA